MEGCENARPAAAASRLPSGSERINCCTRPSTYELCVSVALYSTFPDMTHTKKNPDLSLTWQSYESLNNTGKVCYSSWRTCLRGGSTPASFFQRKWPLVDSMKRAGFTACRQNTMKTRASHIIIVCCSCVRSALCSDAAVVSLSTASKILAYILL